MLGRHNITIYADELERCIGLCKRILKDEELQDEERAYWLGAQNALERIHSYDLPDDATAFVAALKLHFRRDDE